MNTETLHLDTGIRHLNTQDLITSQHNRCVYVANVQYSGDFIASTDMKIQSCFTSMTCKNVVD